MTVYESESCFIWSPGLHSLPSPPPRPLSTPSRATPQIPGFEGRPFAPQVITHDIDTVPISQRDGNLVAPSAVGFKFAPANQPVIASVPVVLGERG